MATSPFYRKIVLWIFILVFLVIAPLVVFYTAGYRWNVNKGKVERNGTVIIDSLPTDASIDIDNRPTSNKTPVTIQDMPPGLHNFRIYKDGYHEWLKNLDVKPELVTFINNIWLWKKAEPVFISPGNISSITISPDKRYMFRLEKTTATVGIITDLLSGQNKNLVIKNSTNSEYSVDWSPDSKYLLLKQNEAANNMDWLIDIKNAKNLGRLPASGYRFNDNTLVGVADNSLLSIRLKDAGVSRSQIATGTFDTSDLADLKTVAGTANLIFVSRVKPEQGYILPAGNWKFREFNKNFLLLNDGRNWLSLLGRNVPEEYHSAQADVLRPFEDDMGMRYLLISYSEIWTWRPDEDPKIIYRQTEKIRDAVWHAQGNDIFFATDKKISVINLDQRDGYRITELAEFDDVKSFAYFKGALQIAATKDDKIGLWSLTVE